jgi:hypothetical protein
MRPNANLAFTMTTRMEPLTLISKAPDRSGAQLVLIDQQIASALPLAQ